MKQFIAIFFVGFSLLSFSQFESFQNASQQYNIPAGVLEAVSYSNTRFHHLDSTYRCTGLPISYSMMGLVENGKNYFRNNLLTVSQLSGISAESIKNNPDSSIYAYANALSERISDPSNWNNVFNGIGSLSELPDETLGQQFAKEAFLYQVYLFLSNEKFQKDYDFPNYQLDGVAIFGNNFYLHQSTKVKLGTNNIAGDGIHFQQSAFKNGTCNDYASALYVAADVSNYSSRNGVAISAITIHDVEGSYAGCISWFQNPAANVSAHYVLRSSDGQITQMVCESEKAWHVGNSNPYAIGFEHEGYASQQGWYTEAMYQASADLVRDICNSGYGINPLRTYKGPPCNGSSADCELGGCIRIKGHQHFPNQTHTDPGIYWDWPHFYQLINEGTAPQEFTASTGSIEDSGGALNNYSDDERNLYLIQFPGMESITLNFELVDLETDWDFIKIYHGSSVHDPLLKTITGTPIVNDTTIFTEALLIEFTSDCATNNAGYKINYSTTAIDQIKPITSIETLSNYQTTNFDINFTDTDNNNEIYKRFYHVSYLNPERVANTSNGFVYDDFDNDHQWTLSNGSWNASSNTLTQTDAGINNTNFYMYCNQNNNDDYLYQVDLNITGATGNRRAGFHFFCDSAHYDNRLNSYFIWLREEDDKIQLYKTDNDVFTLESEINYTIEENTWYHISCLLSTSTGEIDCFIDDSLVLSWTDNAMHSEGNYISLRTGNASASFKNMRVFKSRSITENITVGPESDKDIRKQSSLSIPEIGFIQSLIIDSNYNISLLDEASYKIDWSDPEVSVPKDNNNLDQDTSYSQTDLSGFWLAAEDTNSGIASYEYRIGTIHNPASIIDWQSTTNNNFSLGGLNLSYDSTYVIQLRATNGAGLSNEANSDGIIILDPLNVDEINLVIGVYPNPALAFVQLSANVAIKSYRLLNNAGQIIQQGQINGTSAEIDLSHVAEGTYYISLDTAKGTVLRKILKQ